MKKLAAGLCLALGCGIIVISAQNRAAEPAANEAAPAAAAETSRAPASASAAPAAAVLTKPKMPAAQAEAQARTLVEQVGALQSCYNGGCNYPETDARSYNFGVGQDLKTALVQLAATSRAGDLEGEAIASLAREQLKNEDGHVQEGALALLATQPTSEANLSAVLDNVISGYDAQLIQAALNELLRYNSERDQERIAGALSGAMTSGSPFVAREVSNGIAPFLQPRTVPIYEEAVPALLEGSLVRRDLARAIDAYRSSH